MSFASIVFIFIFLPITLTLYYILPRGNWRLVVLILASLVFFAWGDVRHLPVLIFFFIANYSFGLLIDKFLRGDQPKLKRVSMWLGVIVNLLIMFYCKYLRIFGNFFPDFTIGQIDFHQQAIMLGISYLTFTSLSYLLDISRGIKPAQRNPLNVAAYLIMFPKLIQGPITLFHDIEPQLKPGKIDLEDIHWGIRRFIIGLAKKVLLADTIILVVNKIYGVNPDLLGAGTAWMGLIAFSLVIYFDFAGYTDMALGIGRLFGFKLPENFNFPYISRSITDFWRRWHLSLTNWFRTYVFLPLEFARRRDKFFRQQTNILIVFFLTGLWHGASWNFIVWGIFYGLILAIEVSGFGKRLKQTPVIVQHIYTLTIILIGWAIFSIPDINRSLSFMGALVGLNGLTGDLDLRSLNLITYIPLILAGIVFSTPLPAKLFKGKFLNSSFRWVLTDLAYLGIFVLSLAYILSNGFQAFMYAKF